MSLTNTIINQNQYVLAPSLQMFFIDPTNCQPLSAGTITFYRDLDRTPTGLKPVYRIGGTPTDPVFTPLPNPITLDMCGIFIDPDNGDEILPYYDTYDADGNIDLYYIVIADQFGTVIETIEHFPSINIQQTPTLTHANTLIPNGQFWSHIDLPDQGLINPTDEITLIAFGGWKFQQSPGTTSINFVTFSRYDSPSNTPEQNPRYAAQVRCTQTDPSDAYKTVYCVIQNVNFMQGQDLTLSFTAYSNDGNNHNVDFTIRKNFGTGGSTETTEIIDTVLVTPQIQTFTIPFTMSSNIGKTIGQEDDGDSLNMGLQSPLFTTSDILFTNIFLIAGTFNALDYPPIDTAQDRAYTLASSFSPPQYSGTDVGKYVTVSRAVVGNGFGQSYGFAYDYPVPIGTVLSYGSESVPDGFEKCNGASVPIESDDPIPISDALFSVISYNFGNGFNGFVNNTGVMTNVLEVTWIRFDVVQPIPSAGTSGFTFTLIQGSVANGLPQIYSLGVLAASSIIPGSYYLQPVNTTGPQFIQMFWFTIDGVGTKPTVTHDVSVLIALSSSQTAQQVRDQLISQANGLYQRPDLRGIFIRYWNDDAPTGGGPQTHDSLASARLRSTTSFPYPLVTLPAFVQSGKNGNQVGSYQFWGVGTQESGNLIAPMAGTGTPGPEGLTSTNVTTFAAAVYTGYGTDNRPNNMYFNAIIKT